MAGVISKQPGALMRALLIAIVILAHAIAASGQSIGGLGILQDAGRNKSGPLFYDNFARADTSPGDLGNTPQGQPAYIVYGPFVSSFPLPAATNGYVSNNLYVEDQNNGTYAYQNIHRTPGKVIWNVSWVPAAGATGFSSATILINNSPVGNIDLSVHVQASSVGQWIQTFSGGVVTTLASMSPTVLADGSVYTMTLVLNGASATLNISGGSNNINQTISANDPSIGALSGPHIYFENRMMDAVDAVRFHYIEVD